MSNLSFNVSSFRPVDTKLVLMNSSQIDLSFSSAYATSICADLWSEEGGAFSESQNSSTDGQNDSTVSFAGFPSDQNLICRITVTGESGSENQVHVSINW